MRELDRHKTDADLPGRCAVVGRGRVGPALVGALALAAATRVLAPDGVPA